MKKFAPKVALYILALIYFIFGGAGLFNLLPAPPDLPVKLQTFMTGIMATGYFFPVLKGTETLCGLLLLLGVAPALILVVLAPITLQIVLLHSFLTPGLQNLALPLFMLILHITAATRFWPVYQPLFKRKPVAT